MALYSQRDDAVAVMIMEIPGEPLLSDSKADMLVGVSANLGRYLGERLDQVDKSLTPRVDVHREPIVVR